MDQVCEGDTDPLLHWDIFPEGQRRKVRRTLRTQNRFPVASQGALRLGLAHLPSPEGSLMCPRQRASLTQSLRSVSLPFTRVQHLQGHTQSRVGEVTPRLLAPQTPRARAHGASPSSPSRSASLLPGTCCVCCWDALLLLPSQAGDAPALRDQLPREASLPPRGGASP